MYEHPYSACVTGSFSCSFHSNPENKGQPDLVENASWGLYVDDTWGIALLMNLV
jgi:hypothetical protein